MSILITDIDVRDIRFPTSRTLEGSDAMNADPDYSATYVILKTDSYLEGHALTFTIGRGNEICVQAIESISHLLKEKKLDTFTADMREFWRLMTSDSQLRWLGPEKGVIHMATGALINAVWDLYAKTEGKPLWKLLADMSPDELAGCIDYTYITDVLTRQEAVAMLEKLEPTKQDRIDELNRTGFPAYTTSAGWLGFSDSKIRNLARDAVKQGFRHLKMKVGRNLGDDMRRAAIIRDVIGPDIGLLMDANQNWDVDEAIANMASLSAFDPWWIEEPTSPDDILGHAAIAKAVAPVKVASGEHCQNRVIFKQLMQAGAIAVCQIDSCRVGGVNENLAIMLMAAKFDIPVCPHAGGVGLCEYVQHLSMIDYIAISGKRENRMIEYVDNLHDHFLDPVVINNGAYIPPQKPGFSIQMKPESIQDHEFPGGRVWQEILNEATADNGQS